MQSYEWNNPERLPPVACPLVINLGPEYGWDVAMVERITHLTDKNGEMDYRLASGEVIRGRYPWSYP